MSCQPNIIFIFADDWGYGDLGIHGSAFCDTPCLDRMAAEGVDFQNFTVNNPVCSPSRAAVLTGQFPARHSVHEHFASFEHHQNACMPDWLDPDAPMLPRMLKAAGYATAHYGKWHLSNDHISDAPLPEAYGYDEYGAFNLPINAGEQMAPTDAVPRAIDFMERHREQPFFINLWIHETHTPHYPKAEYLERFDDLNEQQRVYAAVVAEGDAGVGRILDALKALDLDANTLVIFSSDNGPEWTSEERHVDDTATGPGLGAYYSVGETAGLRGRKRSLYSGGIQVPFVARWPEQMPAGKIDQQSVLTAVDLVPTFLSLAGVDLPEGYEPDGEDMMAALCGQKFVRERPIFWEWAPARPHPLLWPHMGVREGPWKLLYNEQESLVELYRIDEDWGEHNDLAAEYPEVVSSLIEKLKAWKATLPTKPPRHCISSERRSKYPDH